MLSCLFYICSSNFPIHIWNKAQQGKWNILHFWWADVKMPSFTFGEYVGSTLSIGGRPLFAYPISWNFHDIKFFTTLIFMTLTFFHDVRLFSGDFHDALLFSRLWKFYVVLIWKLWFFSRCWGPFLVRFQQCPYFTIFPFLESTVCSVWYDRSVSSSPSYCNIRQKSLIFNDTSRGVVEIQFLRFLWHFT